MRSKRPRLCLAFPKLLWHFLVASAYGGLAVVVLNAIESMIQSANTYWICEVFVVLLVGERICQRLDMMHWVIYHLMHECHFFDCGASSRLYNSIGALLEEAKLTRSLLTVCPQDLWRVEHHCFVHKDTLYGGAAGIYGYLPGVVCIKFVPPEVWRGELMQNTSRFEVRSWFSIDLDRFLSECVRVGDARVSEEGLAQPLLYRRNSTTIPEAVFQNL